MRSYSRLHGLLCVLLALVHGDLEICKSSDKCGSNQCCLQKSLTSEQIRICSPLGVQGDECYVPNNYLKDIFVQACPCTDGLSCESVDTSNEKGTCVKRCSSNSVCREKEECCSTITLPNNRTKRSSYLGVCKRLGTANEDCYVEDEISDDVNFLCPCSAGFYCQRKVQNDSDFPAILGACTPVDSNDKAIPGK